jgi:hypothetical protein
MEIVNWSQSKIFFLNLAGNGKVRPLVDILEKKPFDSKGLNQKIEQNFLKL